MLGLGVGEVLFTHSSIVKPVCNYEVFTSGNMRHC